ncbi:MAG TPA: 16S rRNA (guanine(527)-N(7))-methyltransferase RsmG [Burkholderiaceae bacterium]|nr:16S rRNA (guanine(527)-N(7))-methyltransferase RsmG [Burkholderiaceae bacterium]
MIDARRGAARRRTPVRAPTLNDPQHRDALRDRLRSGAQALSVALDERALDALLAYLALLAKWNVVYNLTAIREPEEMLVFHVLDSLAVVRPLQSAIMQRSQASEGDGPAAIVGPAAAVRIADVGSGAGLPGIVLALAWPDAQLTLIETVGKKAAFLRQCAAELGAANVTVREARVESLAPAPQDVVICRAYSELRDFIAVSSALIDQRTLIAAMKGQRPQAELARLPPDIEPVSVERLHVPGLDAERHLVLLRRRLPAAGPASTSQEEGA